MKNKLTTIIPCKDEELNIRPCIESVLDISDELLIADSGSTDKTIDIAKEYNCKIIEREYINSANFKNWAIPQAKNEWILIVDADERVTPELAKEIEDLLAVDPDFDGYKIYRTNYFFGYEIKHCGWNKDHVLRLFRRDLSKYKDMRVHSEVIIQSGKVSFLKEKFTHFTYWSFKQIINKYDRYATWAALDMKDRNIKATIFHLALTPILRFFKHFILQAGFLDGTKGFLVCTIQAYYVFLKYAKLWALYHGKGQPHPKK